MKRSFTLIETIFILLLISLLAYFLIPKNNTTSLDEATNRLILYLKQTRFQAMIDNQYSLEDKLWHKKRWTLKFFRCKESIGGLYYSIYSDTNRTGHPSAVESLKDPLTNKYIYNTNSCKENRNYSPYVLLTNRYEITDIQLSCNSTTSLGQLSFGVNGEVYTKLSPKENEFNKYQLKEPCILTIYHKSGTFREIIIENRTGYIYKK